jgi:hypothetical protein
MKIVFPQSCRTIIVIIQVKPSNPSAIEITQHSKVSGSLHYKVKLLSTYNVDDEVSVKIHSPATLQTIEVRFMYGFL